MKTSPIFSKINAEIKRRNRLWEKATKAQRRVLIAKDVIEQLKQKRFKATCGIYTMPGKAIRAARELESKSMQVGILTPNISCKCCAKGAIVLSKIMFTDKVTIKDDIRYNPTMSIRERYWNTPRNTDPANIKDIFSRNQLNRIEESFEGYRYDNHYVEMYPNSTDRLIAIMENIVENKGTFKP